MFWGAPLISVTAAMLSLSALPIGPFFQIADLNIGLLFILGISSLGIFGIVLGGWASNSHYSLLGALRSAAQLVSYETSAGMAVVGALLLAGTLSTRGNRAATVGRAASGSSLPRRWDFLFTWWRRSRRPTARRSTCPRPNRNWWPAT